MTIGTNLRSVCALVIAKRPLVATASAAGLAVAAAVVVGASAAAPRPRSLPVPAPGPAPPAHLTARRLRPRPGATTPGTIVARSALFTDRVFAGDRIGFALANGNNAQYPALTTDGGRTWRIDGPQVHVDAADGAEGVGAVGIAGPRTFFAYGSSAVDVTTNGGRAWWETFLGELVMAVVPGPGHALIAYVQQSVTTAAASPAVTWQYVSADGGRHWNYSTALDGLPPAPRRRHAGAGLTAAQLRGMAEHMARLCGDRHPYAIRAVRTTRGAAGRVIWPGAGVRPDRTPVYAITMRGRFAASGGLGPHPPTGTVITMVIGAAGRLRGDELDFNLTRRPEPDLARLGRVIRL